MKPRRRKYSTDSDIYLDYVVSKSELSQLLGVTRSTLISWEHIAFWHLDQYRKAYPLKADGTYMRQAPLSEYQAWVLCRVGRQMARLRNAELVKGYVKQNPNEFSRYRYQQSQQQLAKIGA